MIQLVGRTVRGAVRGVGARASMSDEDLRELVEPGPDFLAVDRRRRWRARSRERLAAHRRRCWRPERPDRRFRLGASCDARMRFLASVPLLRLRSLRRSRLPHESRRRPAKAGKGPIRPRRPRRLTRPARGRRSRLCRLRGRAATWRPRRWPKKRAAKGDAPSHHAARPALRTGHGRAAGFRQSRRMVCQRRGDGRRPRAIRAGHDAGGRARPEAEQGQGRGILRAGRRAKITPSPYTIWR